jgi:hypothetical protein
MIGCCLSIKSNATLFHSNYKKAAGNQIPTAFFVSVYLFLRFAFSGKAHNMTILKEIIYHRQVST